MGKKSRGKRERKANGEGPKAPEAPKQKAEDLIGRPFQIQLNTPSLESLGRSKLPGELGVKLRPRLLEVETNHRLGVTPVVIAHFILEPDMAGWNAPKVAPQEKVVKIEKGKGKKDAGTKQGK